jgi:hypothetical protein
MHQGAITCRLLVDFPQPRPIHLVYRINGGSILTRRLSWTIATQTRTHLLSQSRSLWQSWTHFVIRILNPIANEDGHEQRYRASDLNRKFEDIRTTMLKSAAETISYRVSALNK